MSNRANTGEAVPTAGEHGMPLTWIVMTVVQVKADPRRSEIVQARLALCTRIPLFQACLLAGLLVPALFAVVGLRPGHNVVVFLAPMVLALVVPVAFMLGGRAGQLHVMFTDTGVTVNEQDETRTTSWRAVRMALETEHGFVVWAGTARVLPKRCFASPRAVDEVREVLATRLGARAAVRVAAR